MPDDPSSDPASPRWFARLKGVFEPDAPAGAGDETSPDAAADAGRSAASRARVTAAARFDSLRVTDVMVPRADIAAIDADTALGEAVERFAEAAHSRMPVYRESLDEPIGMVHIKDVLRLIAPSRRNGHDIFQDRVLASIARPVLYVPPSMPAADLLLKMQSRRVHMAIVVDEFGGTDGLVTLEDLVEEIVGDIADEHDVDDEPSVRPRSALCWDVDARAAIDLVEETVGASLKPDDLVEDVDTLGGLVFSLAGRVPERGEVIKHPDGFEFEVAEADPRRIKRLIVRAPDAPNPTPPAAPTP